MSQRAIVSVTNDLYTDQRVHKICLFLKAQGYDVLLVGRKRRSSPEMPDRTYQTARMKLLFEKGALFYAAFNFRLFFFLLFRKADVLVSNDLDTLLANYLAHRLKRKSRLVYDSHEYFTEVPELVNRPKVQSIWLKIERFIFPKLTTIYTVNRSIAEIYHRLYGKELFVVRNISPRWKPNNIASKRELGIPEDKPLIILQGAGINIQRGAEEAVEAMKKIDGVLLIVGDGDVVPMLKEYVEKEQLQEKVIFFGRQPYDRMMNFTYHADIGLSLDKPQSANYEFSLPNKVFDYMHATTPIVCTEIKEVAAVVRNNDIGKVVSDFTSDQLAETINHLIADPTELLRLKQNCELASERENWEKETEILAKIYPKVEE